MLYVGFCLTLVWHYKEDHWDSLKTYLYFYTLLLNNVFNALFSLVVFVATLIKYRVSKKVAVKVKRPTTKKISVDHDKVPREIRKERSRINDHRPQSFRSNTKKSFTMSKCSNISRQSQLSLRERFSLADIDMESFQKSE
mmetsp:Transcript_17750/g.17448  ORF Transcript_17750/g.17448 Transcript_17750/m.17448 type:complete len:140 (-) Transcript_17750:14-433(-)